MDWRQYIEQNPDIAEGRPVVKGSHLEVEFVLRQMAEGFGQKEILENYPVMDKEGYKAILVYAAEVVAKHGADE